MLYQWLPFVSHTAGSSPNAENVDATQATLKAPIPLAHAEQPDDSKRVAIVGATIPHVEQPRAVDPSMLPSCESVQDEPDEPTEQGQMLPVNLSRTPLGSLLDFSGWTKPCRGPKAMRVHLCLAVKNGNVLAATARAEPSDADLERCIIRAALRVPLEPEAMLRKVQLDVEVARERAR